MKKHPDILEINWNLVNNYFNLQLKFEEIQSIKLIDEEGLYIKFEKGELRLDITKEDLRKIVQIF